MQDMVLAVMDERLVDLFSLWRRAFVTGVVDDPLVRFAGHADHLLLVELDGAQSRYDHYGRFFVEQFGADLTGQVIGELPEDILPVERRTMLEFEYRFAQSAQRPLWRSYTAWFGTVRETWQRLVLPLSSRLLAVGAYSLPASARGGAAGQGQDAALLRLVIERVPVVLDADGQVRDLALSLEDFSDTQQHVAELEVLATQDALTGVANLRHFHHLAGLELDHARRMGRQLSLLAMDLDHFKRINDNWGHAAGDAALQAFVAACRVALREQDILARVGGEEFVVALPSTGTDGARIIGERLRRQVEELTVEVPSGGSLRFTVSIGIATLPSPDSAELPTAASLMAQADAALYHSKATGRNRVTVAGEGEVA